jgi:cytochrome c oxidase cbb3-type subunit 3
LVIAACGGRSATPPAIRYPQHVAVEGLQPAGADLTNPFAADAKSVEEGRRLFTSMNCDGCHGGGATGFIAPSLSDGRWRYGATDGALYQSIYYGRPQGMPAFGGFIQEPVVWKLVAYLKSLPVPAAVPTQAW